MCAPNKWLSASRVRNTESNSHDMDSLACSRHRPGLAVWKVEAMCCYGVRGSVEDILSASSS